ncbi:MAG: DUF2842 domain-containing protein [Maricaulaceae bacterium]
MARGLRIGLGMAGLLIAFPLYVGVAVTIGGMLPDWVLLQAIYYLVAGVSWALPLRPWLNWMMRPDTA